MLDIFAHRSGSIIQDNSSKATRKSVKSDKRKLNDILKMCIDKEYLKALEADRKKPKAKRSNNASYTLLPDSLTDADEEEVGNGADLAFRKKAQDALN